VDNFVDRQQTNVT